MNQVTELSETGLDERFHISSQTAIQFMLAGFAREHRSFSVYFSGDQEMFLTTLLAVEPKRLIIDCSGSPESNQRFLASERSVFVARPDGVQINFSTGQAVEVNFEGAKAFAVSLPRMLVRLQRRDSFRIETPRLRPLEFFARLPAGDLLKLPVHNVSVCGIGLLATVLPEELVVGCRLDNCHFSLPGDSSDLFFSATLRHIDEGEARNGQRQWRLGLQFNDLPLSAANRIQRYIARIEHERRELS